MIDVNTETLVTFSDLARRLPHRRNNRPTHVATIHRWRVAGVRGVRLDAVRLGGTWVTSTEAYARFCEELTAAASSGTTPPSPSRKASPTVDHTLEQLGL